MVDYSPVAHLRRRQPSDNPMITPATVDLTDDLDPVVIPHFTTTAARDSAYAALITAGTVGMTCTVGNPAVWFGYNGAAWITDLARRKAYSGAKNFLGCNPGVDVPLGDLPDQNGFLGVSAGLTVPEEGVYVATLTASTSIPVVTNRTYVQITAASTIARNYSNATGAESRLSVTLAGIQLNAGDTLGLWFGHNASGAIDVQVFLTVAKVAS